MVPACLGKFYLLLNPYSNTATLADLSRKTSPGTISETFPWALVVFLPYVMWSL